MIFRKKSKIIGCIIGSIILFGSGLFIGRKHSKKEDVSGILRIDNSDPDSPNNLFLELTSPIEDISHKKEVSFKVLTENYLRK